MIRKEFAAEIVDVGSYKKIRRYCDVDAVAAEVAIDKFAASVDSTEVRVKAGSTGGHEVVVDVDESGIVDLVATQELESECADKAHAVEVVVAEKSPVDVVNDVDKAVRGTFANIDGWEFAGRLLAFALPSGDEGARFHREVWGR